MEAVRKHLRAEGIKLHGCTEVGIIAQPCALKKTLLHSVHTEVLEDSLFFSGGAGIRRLEIRKWLKENHGDDFSLMS